MSTLRISDAPLLPNVDGTEKIPTGGRGDYAISVDQIKDHIFEDVGKELVGLGNVDNTSDLDKPVSTAQQAALNLKADKTYVDVNLELKADKTNVYTRSETTLALSTKADLVNGVIPENQIPSSFNDVLEFTTSTLPIVGESGKIYVTTDTNRTWRWGGNQYIEISDGGVSDSTLKLQTPRKIANVNFDGTQDISIPHNNLTNRDSSGAHTASAILDVGGLSQQDINDATIQKVKTITELIDKSPRGNGQVINVESYFAPNYALADPYMGGDKFIWQANVSKSLHDGGYVIDPLIPIPSLATFNTYHTAKNSTNGVWVRLSDSNDILAENYGLSQSASAVWNCSGIQKALFRAASVAPHKRVMLPAGAYRTTNPIILSKYTGSAQSGNTYRVPALIGKGRFATELAKVTKNTVGSGYQCGDIDAVVVCSPKTGEYQIFSEHTGGFGLMRYDANSVDSGYGYYSINSPYGNRFDMRMNRADHGYYQDTCWMSSINNINAISCKNGITIRGGTSVNGAGLYADTCSQIGIDLYGLTYSSLSVHADQGGKDPASPIGYPAIRCNFTKGVNLTASTEHHRGADFEILYSDGLVVNGGRSFNATAVSAPTSRVVIEDSQVVFNAFSWKHSLNNLGAQDASLYSFMTKRYNNVTYEMNGCGGNDQWSDFPNKVSGGQYAGKKTFYSYSEESGFVTSRVHHNNAEFRRWFYAGDAIRFKVIGGVCENSDRFVDFSGTILTSAISKDPATPTILPGVKYYANGQEVSSFVLHAYYNEADKWVYIKTAYSGENYIFRYTLIK